MSSRWYCYQSRSVSFENNQFSHSVAGKYINPFTRPVSFEATAITPSYTLSATTYRQLIPRWKWVFPGLGNPVMEQTVSVALEWRKMEASVPATVGPPGDSATEKSPGWTFMVTSGTSPLASTAMPTLSGTLSGFRSKGREWRSGSGGMIVSSTQSVEWSLDASSNCNW